MNKQELIESIAHLPSDCSRPRPMIDKLTALELIKLLEEPQKVAIPQFVAEWIEHCKFTNVNLQNALLAGDVYFYSYANQKDFSKLKEFLDTENNQETFARAWLDGYEVEEEKRYLVRMRKFDEEYNFLNYNTKSDLWLFSSDAEYIEYRVHHTRKELEEAGFGWIFSCEGIEVREVE